MSTVAAAARAKAMRIASPLHHAAQSGPTDEVQKLLLTVAVDSLHADAEDDRGDREKEGWTALHIACARASAADDDDGEEAKTAVAIVGALLTAGADAERVAHQGGNMIAVGYGGTATHFSKRPIHLAHRSTAALQLLARHGADLTSTATEEIHDKDLSSPMPTRTRDEMRALTATDGAAKAAYTQHEARVIAEYRPRGRKEVDSEWTSDFTVSMMPGVASWKIQMPARLRHELELLSPAAKD